MLVTGIILIGIVFYAIWAVRKIHKNRKNGSCCSGSCSGCVGKTSYKKSIAKSEKEKGKT